MPHYDTTPSLSDVVARNAREARQLGMSRTIEVSGDIYVTSEDFAALEVRVAELEAQVALLSNA